jgi:hypothetical protein
LFIPRHPTLVDTAPPALRRPYGVNFKLTLAPRQYIGVEWALVHGGVRVGVLCMWIDGWSSSSVVQTDAAQDEEELRIGAALAYMREQGNLDGYPSRRNERTTLMTTPSAAVS